MAEEREWVYGKGTAFVRSFDRAMDPVEMTLGFRISSMLPNRTWERLYSHWPPRFVDTASTVCSCFLSFTDWKDEEWTEQMYERLPPDWAEKRREIEAEWPLRHALIMQLEVEIENVCAYDADAVVSFFQGKARRHWALVRELAKAQSVVSYWVHLANRPGSAGFLNGMREVCGRNGAR